MEAAARLDSSAASSTRSRFAALVTAGAILYSVILIVPSGYSPVRLLVPTAFVFSGLVYVSIAAAWANGIVFLHRAELIAVDEVRRLWRSEAAAGTARTVIALGAAILGAWAIPMGFLATGLTRWLGFSKSLAVVYTARSHR